MERKEQHKRRFLALVLAAVLLTGCGIGFTAGVHYPNAVYAEEPAQDLTINQITAKVANSVVEIRTESVQNGTYMKQYISEGAGSGVIVSSDGYIVTNHHVIDGANKITVTLRNGTSYSAVLKGTDEATDLAILKIEASGLTTAAMGTSSDLQVGETAVVIGNPLGELGGTVTAGIVSALGREINLEGKTMTLLQTDAAVNPGNSGGGLFDGQGDLIGIVAAKSSGNDVEGLGFAIPVDTVKPVIQELMAQGYVSGRVSLGMTLVNSSGISSPFAGFFFGGQFSGVYVSAVASGSNAAKAGIRQGDQLYSFDGTRVTGTTEVTALMQNYSVGDTVTLELLRKGKLYEISLELEEYKQ